MSPRNIFQECLKVQERLKDIQEDCKNNWIPLTFFDFVLYKNYAVNMYMCMFEC